MKITRAHFDGGAPKSQNDQTGATDKNQATTIVQSGLESSVEQAKETSPSSPDSLCSKLNKGLLMLAADKVEVKGQLPKGGVVVCSNHPSYMDGPAAFGLPDLNLRPVAADHGAIRNIGLKWSGCILTQKGQVVSKAAEYVEQGGNLWIAPAGVLYQGELKTEEDMKEGQSFRTGAVAIAMAAGKPLVPMAFDVESSLTAARNFEYAGQAILAATLGLFGGLALSSFSRAAGSVALGAGFAGAHSAFSKRKRNTIKAQIGQPIELLVPESDSSESQKVAIKENCNRMAKAINGLQKAQRKNQSFLAHIREDPTGLFTPAPKDGGLEKTIQQVLKAEEFGLSKPADLRTENYRTEKNTLKLHIDSSYFSNGILPAILNAEKSISIAVSLLGNDALGQQVINCIQSRLKERPNLVVNLLVDGATSEQYSQASWGNLERLRTDDKESETSNTLAWLTSLLRDCLPQKKEKQYSNVQVLRNNTLTQGLEHRKVAVIDSKRAFLGGTAMGEGYCWSQRKQKAYAEAIETGFAPEKLPPKASEEVPQWHDTQVEITGPAVQQLQSNILLSVIYQGGSIAPPAVVTDRSMSPKEREHSIRDFWFPRIESEGESTVKIGQSIPFQRNEVLASGRALIDKAEKTVFMHAAYFTCDKYISVLKSALERGVKVNIGVPGGFDKASSHYVWRNKVKSLLECSGAENLRVFELTKDEENGRSGYNHDKWIVVDDTLVWVSTGNPEPFSEYQGFDSSFTAKDSGLGKELQLLFEKDSLVSDRVTLDTLKNMTPSEKKQGTLYSAMLGTAGTLFSSMRDNHDIY